MNSWKNIHSDFTPQLQKEWESNSFIHLQAQDWINIGLTPHDCSFATYLRDVVNCEPEEALNFVSDITELKDQYQEYLQSQSEESEESQLARAKLLSLGVFDFRDDPLEGLTDQELEQYLSTKRLNLKKYFVFNLGQEVKIKPKITVSDSTGKIVSEPIPNIRQVKPLLTEHLTKLFSDGSEKSAISFTGKNTNQPSQAWTGSKLDQKIANGEEVYIVFDKSRIGANASYVRSKADSTTQLGYMDWPEIVVLAMEAKPQVQVFQSKKNALKFLRENDFKCKAVSCPKQPTMQQNYCSYHQACLDKLQKKETITGIQEIDTFKTWFNENCGYVINKDNAQHSFHLWLIIYEPKHGKVEEGIFPMRFWKSKSLTNAQKKAQETKTELQKRGLQVSPMAFIHWKADEYTAFDDLVRKHYVREIEVPCETENAIILFPVNQVIRIPAEVMIRTPNKSPENYLKPLDVVWVKMKLAGVVPFCHVGVYLGKDDQGVNWVCHFSRARQDEGVIITKWKDFVEGCTDGEVIGYHPVLPFKYHGLTVRQIVYAEENDYWKDNYNLFNRNCEHFANMATFGINYSNQIEKKKELIRTIARTGKSALFGPMLLLTPNPTLNNGKGSTIKLTDELKETYDKLGYTQKDHEIATELEARILVPSKQDCKIM